MCLWVPEANSSEGPLLTPREVAESQPNTWGLHDLRGDAMEWCFDAWYDSPKGAKDLNLRPHGPEPEDLRQEFSTQHVFYNGFMFLLIGGFVFQVFSGCCGISRDFAPFLCHGRVLSVDAFCAPAPVRAAPDILRHRVGSGPSVSTSCRQSGSPPLHQRSPRRSLIGPSSTMCRCRRYPGRRGSRAVSRGGDPW